MRILLYAPNYLPATRYGGPIQSSHGLAKALAGRGHDVHVFTTNVDGPDVLEVPLRRPVLVDNVTVRYFPTTFPKRLYYAPSMDVAISRDIANFDVAHINGMYLWPGHAVAAASARREIPYLISPRGMLAPEMIAGRSAMAKRTWIRVFGRGDLARAAAIHVTSDEEADGIRRLGLDLAQIETIGNGVELPAQLPNSDEIDELWGDAPRGQRAAFLGRLDWTKGLDLLIHAARQVPEAYLLIAGPDQIGLRASLEPLLAKGRFLGPVNGLEKWALLSGADVLIAPSIRESFGLAVAEALAVGTPVICTEGVGASSIVRRIDPDCVVPRTTDAIAHALSSILSDAPRRARFGRDAKRIISEEYAWRAIASRMEVAYHAAITRAADGRRDLRGALQTSGTPVPK